MVETIGQAMDAGWTIKVYCRGARGDAMKKRRLCIDSLDIDMRTLVWTRGRGMPLSGLAERLRCPSCGSRKVAVAFNPPAGAATMTVRLRR